MSVYPRGIRALAELTNSEAPETRVRIKTRSGSQNTDTLYFERFAALQRHIEAGVGSTFDLLLDSYSDQVNLSGTLKSPLRFSNIDVSRSKSVTLSNAIARKVFLAPSELSIENFSTLDLTIRLSRGGVRLNNCNIGILEIQNAEPTGFSGDITIQDCTILVLRLPKNLAARNVEFRNVKFATDCEALPSQLRGETEKRLSLDRASFGFLHDWAVKSGNTEIAPLARGNELAIERRTATKGLERFILALWFIFGNFGLSPMRPIIWMFVAMIVMCVILFCTGTSLSIPADELVGWRNALQDTKDYSGALARAAAGTLEGGVSPLSVFSSRRMIIPNSEWIAGLQVLYGYFCIAMFLLFGFSVRRRFKIS